MKAIIAPSLEPDAIIVCMIGAADSVVNREATDKQMPAGLRRCCC
jgi:hypothetical protein